MQRGYAYRSSRRHPRDPQITILTGEEIDLARYVGDAFIDGRAHAAFKIPNEACYFFVLPQNVND
jgi:hypothetical protein